MNLKSLFTVAFIALVVPLYLPAQINLSYQKPDKEILDIVDAPLPPSLEVNSAGTTALLLYRRSFKSIEALSNPELRLAGLRINPKTNIYSRQRSYYQLKILDIPTGSELDISNLPEGEYSNFSWSRDEKQIAVTNTESEGVSIWVIDVENAAAKRLTEPTVNANLGSPFTWLDSENLLVKMLPENRPEIVDRIQIVPKGPVISENQGKKAQNRTYQDLLKTPTDETNFETLAHSVIHLVNLDGTSTPWKESNMYRTLSVSPDNRYVLVSIVQRPFSYLVPYYRFTTETDVYRANGDFVASIEQVPLIEDLPKGFMATHTYKRNISWREDRPASLWWVMALDEGDPAAEVTDRDAVYTLDVPFAGPGVQVATTINRFSDIQWGNGEMAVLHDRWFSDRNTKAYLIDPSGQKERQILFDRNYQDRYSDPGDFVTRKNEYGMSVLAIDEGKMFLEGPGYSDRGIHPFIDAYDLTTRQSTRLYQAAANERYERIRSVIDPLKGEFLVSIEAPAAYPNFYIRNYKTRSLRQITNFDNPFETIQSVRKEVINYKREDGLDLSGTLYLPADYDLASGNKLPMLLWAYPVEYKDKTSAGQISSSPYQFTYPSYGSPIFWVARGYAVLDRAAFPIVGEDDEEPNDSFRQQLVANGKAAIDAVDALGYIDRNRVGVGGHSYGAFMTANLLSHSNLFAAGIARSGAYNRTLTPFGFQREERSYWEDPEVYYTMSPFMHADKMKTPLLLIHGEADNNSGTYPMQSERYFNALKGLGATVRLVMLPKESHGYAARESILHMLWEQDQWLEKYVKNRDRASTEP